MRHLRFWLKCEECCPRGLRGCRLASNVQQLFVSAQNCALTAACPSCLSVTTVWQVCDMSQQCSRAGIYWLQLAVAAIAILEITVTGIFEAARSDLLSFLLALYGPL